MRYHDCRTCQCDVCKIVRGDKRATDDMYHRAVTGDMDAARHLLVASDRLARELGMGQKERPRYCEACGRVSPLYLESCECGAKEFTFTPPWRLTSNDRRFLRAIRIDPEHNKKHEKE